jgi:Ig-like domain CHU_C associated
MDNIPGPLTFTQSIPIGTLIIRDTIQFVSIRDAANNIKNCSYSLKINPSTSSSQNIISPYIYKDPLNIYHASSGNFNFTIPNSKNCDSLITVNYTKTQIPNVLNFEQMGGSVNWVEDSLSWLIGAGLDNIQNGSNAKSGSGYGKFTSGSASSLIFPSALNLGTIWVKYYHPFNTVAIIKGYDSTLINDTTLTIYSAPGYQEIPLNWTNIKKIDFVVPQIVETSPPNVSNGILYYDDLAYTPYTSGPPAPDTTPPTLTCAGDTSACNTFTIINFAANAVATDLVSGINIIKIQSVPVGTVVTRDTIVYVTATDQAGNFSTCAVNVKINRNTSSTQNIIRNTAYQDLAGVYHFTSGSFVNIIPNAKGCDSTITTNLTVNQQLNVLNFEVPANNTSWLEDGYTWSWNSSTDKIGNGAFAHTGVGYGKASSNTTSKLVFPTKLNLSSIWIRPNPNASMFPFYATMYGYDSLGTVLYSKSINAILSYHQLTLNWQNVRSIGFDIPMGQNSLPGFPGSPINMPVSQDIYYDDLAYTVFAAPVDTIPPSIFCLNPQIQSCNNYVVSNLASNAMFGDNSTPVSQLVITQSIPVGTVIIRDTLNIVTVTDLAGNSSSCTYIIKINKNTSSSQNITANTSYKDINNVYHYVSGSFQNTIPNAKGCDSVITTNLTINQIPNVLNFDVAPNLTAWNEDGKAWSWNGSTDKIAISANAYLGTGGAGIAVSGTTSKLNFPQALNVSNIWVKFQQNGPSPFDPIIYAYDASGVVLYQQSINNISGYQQLSLNWQNVNSIGFSVPPGMPGGPGPGGMPMPTMNHELFYDEMGYTFYAPVIDTTAPTIICANSVITATTCETFVVPNLTIGNAVNDNVSSAANITITQSVAAGTIINVNTGVKILATDEAGNKDSCTVLLKVIKSSASYQNIIANTSFKDANGVFYYASATYTATIQNAAGCDSIITYNVTINQTLNILNFDVAPNSTSWSEDGLFWSWDGGTDKIGNGYDAKAGFGYGKASTGTTSKLVFPQALNLSNIWVKTQGGASPSFLRAYNSSGTMIYEKWLLGSGYQNVILDWQNVSSIGFSVPVGMPGGPGPGGTTMPPVPNDLYYDEMGYSLYLADTIKPVINCISSIKLCENSIIPNFYLPSPSPYFIASDNIGIDSITQFPLAGTAFNIAQNDSINITFTATDFAGNQKSCSLVAKPKLKTSSSITVNRCGNYVSPSGKVYFSSGIYKDTVQNFVGCDSIITTNLTINPQNIPSNITANKTTICSGELVTFQASCSVGTSLEWRNNFGIWGSVIGTSDSIKINVYSYSILNVQCNGLCTGNGVRVLGSDFLNSTPLFNISINAYKSAPIVTNSVFSGCEGDSIIFRASGCGVDTVFWSNGLKGDSIILHPTSSFNISAKCSGSCSNSSFPISVNVIPLQKPTLVLLHPTNKICVGTNIFMQITGCPNTGQVQFNTNNADIYNSYSSTTYFSPIVNTSYKAKCYGNQCPHPYSDSINVVVVLDSIKTPVLDTSKTFICNTELVNYLSSSCILGVVRWYKVGLIETQYPYSYDPIINGETLQVWCDQYGCKSQLISYKVKVNIKPKIISSQTTFCTGKTVTLSTPSCSSPNYYPEWKIFNDIDNTSSFLYTPYISATLTQGTKVSLKCFRNNVTYYCGTDTSLFIPQFLDNTLISNIQISANNLCQGSSHTVSYTLNGTFPANNIFRAELSDADGLFTNPLNIGQSTGPNSLSFTVSIPQNLTGGSNYKIRVVPSFTNLGSGPFFCYESANGFTILGKNILFIYLQNSTTCIGSSLRSVSYLPTSKYRKFIQYTTCEISKVCFFLAGLYKVKYTRIADACEITSDTIRLNVNSVILPPTLADSVINVVKGVATNFGATCQAGSSLIWALSPYSFSGLYPTYNTGSITVYSNSKYYLACKSGTCISDYKSVQILSVVLSGAPNAPLLTVQGDSTCGYNYVTPPTITATGCLGTVSWSSDPNFSFTFAVQTAAPYVISNIYGGYKIYANCEEAGKISASSEANMKFFLKPNPPTAVIPTDSYNFPNDTEILVNKNSDLVLNTNSHRTFGSGEWFPVCNNGGSIKWFDTPTNGQVLGTGSSFSKLNIQNDFNLYVSCTSIEGCESIRKKIIVTVDSLNPKIVISKNKYTICGSGSANLIASGCENTGIKWFSDPAGINNLFTGNTFTTPSFVNNSDTNVTVKYYVKCIKNTLSSPLSIIDVVVSPIPNIPIVSDTVFVCNTEITSVFIPKGCNPKFERVIWYKTDNVGEYYDWDQPNPNYNPPYFENAIKTYKVACQNKLSTCESLTKTFQSSFNCTVPPTPVINVVNTGLNTSTVKGNTGNSGPTETFATAIQACVGGKVTLNVNNCINGGVFWSDGTVGTPKVVTVNSNIFNLSASCKAFTLVKSANSNSIDFVTKPTPVLNIADSLISATSVNLTATSNFAQSILPSGSVLGYYQDSSSTIILQNPSVVSVSNKYYIKATAPSGCFDVEPVIVFIDVCSQSIVMVPGIDNANSGTINKKTSKNIQASNKIIDSARVSFQAGQFLLFTPGFESKPNGSGVFKAEVRGCP